ncbi:MAG: hypothetical protein ACLT3H_02620 [Roseburia sp.]
MAKVKLCAMDEGNLVEEMKSFGEALRNLGISGTVYVSFSDGEDIFGTFTVNKNTKLDIAIEKDGNKTIMEYIYV